MISENENNPLTAKVELALSLLRMQPHQLDLLARANAAAIKMLKHSLRNAPKAARLRNACPEPKLMQRCGKYLMPGANAAACVAILALAKAGIFESVDKFQTQGTKAMHQYYAKHVGTEMADNIFSDGKQET